ncbi:class I SAM-dependent methyltransferase [Aureimonas leprariae]|uniref:Methyltransferase domain-containing protein n=1 Tax=Plantimonas leprariae TaxID=2615207 RepID=A0A7V7PPA6_9HYPH|nr:50S ribosomal protein L11 methyltransferase [Aureimonas leprariae]KAB0679727.1 methyltransferase domain-containing protein [Aureimonas leprariae]
MSAIRADAGSFRDPSGRVFHHRDRVLRSVGETARAAYEAVRDKGLFEALAARGAMVASRELPRSEWPDGVGRAAYLLDHERIDTLSYPYEWGFGQLKAAALLHLDLQVELLDNDIVLSDATAYNVQFAGARPVFIDVLSLRPYREREYWEGHRQFCEQFLNPLLLRALAGVAHNAWYRGSLEGIPTLDLARLLPWRKRVSSWNVLSQVTLQAGLERRAIGAPDAAVRQARSGQGLSRLGYAGILQGLRRWIGRLEPADTGKTVWGDYAASHTYTGPEVEAKRRFVEEFAKAERPRRLLDLGCNTGDYSLTALAAGAGKVVGFDFDQRAIDLAFSRAQAEDVDFLPLWLDAANPSPDQGWRQRERPGFASRMRSDALIALAFEHHLAIGRNVPLPDVVEWLTDLAPTGVIEFVPKTDETVRRMLALRTDIFPDYTQEAFERELRRNARIVREAAVSASGRVLFQYDRR